MRRPRHITNLALYEIPTYTKAGALRGRPYKLLNTDFVGIAVDEPFGDIVGVVGHAFDVFDDQD